MRAPWLVARCIQSLQHTETHTHSLKHILSSQRTHRNRTAMDKPSAPPQAPSESFCSPLASCKQQQRRAKVRERDRREESAGCIHPSIHPCINPCIKITYRSRTVCDSTFVMSSRVVILLLLQWLLSCFPLSAGSLRGLAKPCVAKS